MDNWKIVTRGILVDYNTKVIDHCTNPRNIGIIENCDGIGEVGNVKCGDIMKIFLKIEGDQIVDVKFQTFGCGAAIASSSMATELIKGKNWKQPGGFQIKQLQKL